MDAFTIITAIAGGALIALGAATLLYSHGKIAGISGISGGLLSPKRGDLGWRIAFIAGLGLAGILGFGLMPGRFEVTLDRSTIALLIAGLMVGFGARLANGCTSGHGVCGVGRLSSRSLVATLTFTASGGLMVFIVNRFLGGAV